MEKCFYHTGFDAVSTCLGCKMPICQTCKDAGQSGFCEHCLKKVASLSQSVQDTKKTGVVNNQKATMLKRMGAPVVPPSDAAKCFHHFEVTAQANCPTCNRAFCGACLNANGVCSHCEALGHEAAAASPASAAPRAAARRPVASATTAVAVAPAQDPTKLVVAAVLVLLVLLVAGWGLHRASHHAGAAHSQHISSN